MNLSIQLETLSKQLAAGVKAELENGREAMHTEMAELLEDKFVHDVFGKQKSPEGVSWPKISPLTLAVRRQQGGKSGGSAKRRKKKSGCGKGGKRRPSSGNSKLGTGPRNAMIRSFQLGDSNNVFKSTRRGFTYGSKLKRKGHFVAETFQETYYIPKSANSKEAACVRRFMLAVAGIAAPANGKRLLHPGRKVVSMPAAWQVELGAIHAEHAEAALARAMQKASRLAASRVAGTAAGAVPRRISVVG